VLQVAYLVLSVLLLGRSIGFFVFVYADVSLGHRLIGYLGLGVALLFFAGQLLYLFVVKESVWRHIAVSSQRQLLAFKTDLILYRDFQWFVTLLALDVQFVMCWFVMSLVETTWQAISITVAVWVCSVCWSLLGWYAALRRKHGAFHLFFLLSFFVPVIVVYQV
jgi:hypothetical protein